MTDVLEKTSVRAVLNFAADKGDGGRFCNTDLSLSSQKLEPHEMTIINARTLDTAPSLDREGFEIVEHALPDADWYNDEWLEKVYAPSCDALVKKETGASRVVHFYKPLRRIANPEKRGENMFTAGFVHIDHPRDEGREISQFIMQAMGETPFKRATLYNVWKAITPAPQDRPLTVADRRTVPESAHVVGTTVTKDGNDSAYVILANDPAMQFYYFSDMNVDESIVFTGVDFDPANPLGCAHSAFSHPDAGVSRASIEARIIAVYE